MPSRPPHASLSAEASDLRPPASASAPATPGHDGAGGARRHENDHGAPRELGTRRPVHALPRTVRRRRAPLLLGADAAQSSWSLGNVSPESKANAADSRSDTAAGSAVGRMPASRSADS